MFTVFALPEAGVIHDVNQMAQEGLVFDHTGIDAAITGRTWIPSYCQF
jgi:hypothetical protein